MYISCSVLEFCTLCEIRAGTFRLLHVDVLSIPCDCCSTLYVLHQRFWGETRTERSGEYHAGDGTLDPTGRCRHPSRTSFVSQQIYPRRISPIVANDTMLRIDEGVRQMWSVPTLMCRSEGALRGIFILPREYEATRG